MANNLIKKAVDRASFLRIYQVFKEYTMIPSQVYINKLILAKSVETVPGCIVECGVWRGGMIGGISRVLGNDRKYVLFDSFQGLPEANEIDGQEAIKWQAAKHGPHYFNNCAAEKAWAEKAMKRSGSSNYEIVEGWFEETVPNMILGEEIAVLHLDGDWYESTKICLEEFFPKVAPGGLVLIDDYLTWDGCSRAVHDYLSSNSRSEKIIHYRNNTTYIIKK